MEKFKNIFLLIIMILGLLSFTFVFYILVGMTYNKIKDATAKRRKMKKLKWKIRTINKLISEINNEGKRVTAKGKYLVLHDALEVELSDKEIK